MKKQIAIFILPLFLLFSCAHKESKTNNIKTEAVNFIGTYEGILPCADCEGIETVVILRPDNQYVMKSKYLGQKGLNSYDSKGSYTWHQEKQIITLHDPQGPRHSYMVGNNTLHYLDQDGKKIAGALADYYILKKLLK